MSRFLDSSEEHCILGRHVLTRLISDMIVYIRNVRPTHTIRRTITHYKASKILHSFRELLLLKCFNISFKLSPSQCDHRFIPSYDLVPSPQK